MIDVIVSGGLNLTVEDTGDIINVTVEVAAPIAVEVVVGIPTKENIVGLTKSDSPEFADVVIPDIAAESSYTASAWAWLTGLFGVVTGSVKAMLVGLVERVAALDERVGELEDNLIREIIIDDKTAEVIIEDIDEISIKLIVYIPYFISPSDEIVNGRFHMQVNDVNVEYTWGPQTNVTVAALTGSAYPYHMGNIEVNAINDNLVYNSNVYVNTISGGNSLKLFHKINKIKLFTYSLNSLIPSGSAIKVIKI